MTLYKCKYGHNILNLIERLFITKIKQQKMELNLGSSWTKFLALKNIEDPLLRAEER